MPEELVITALQLAQRPAPGLIVYSDRGGQCGGNACWQLLHAHEAVRSQGRRGGCDDNAQAESRWARLKVEVLERHEWPISADLADTQASVPDYSDY